MRLDVVVSLLAEGKGNIQGTLATLAMGCMRSQPQQPQPQHPLLLANRDRSRSRDRRDRSRSWDRRDRRDYHCEPETPTAGTTGCRSEPPSSWGSRRQ